MCSTCVRARVWVPSLILPLFNAYMVYKYSFKRTFVGVCYRVRVRATSNVKMTVGNSMFPKIRVIVRCGKYARTIAYYHHAIVNNTVDCFLFFLCTVNSDIAIYTTTNNTCGKAAAIEIRRYMAYGYGTGTDGVYIIIIYKYTGDEKNKTFQTVKR